MGQRLRRAEQVERNREVVLSAARRVLLERGYAGASLDAIAEEAGFSKGVVYSQFGSKADLFLALLARRIAERAAQNDRIADDHEGADGVRALLRTASQDASAEQGWANLLTEFRSVAGRDPRLNARYAEAHAESVRRLEAVLARLHAKAGLDPAAPLRTMAEFVLAFGAGATLERTARPDALPEADVVEMLPRALGMCRGEDPVRAAADGVHRAAEAAATEEAP